MPLVHGRAITSEEIERLVSERFSPRDFASLCNAIAWASAGRRCSSLPSFTERVNAKDAGIDAEWHVELPDDQGDSSALLGPGWNVYQYKQRSIITQDRQTAFSKLLASLSGAIRDLHDRTGRPPDRYVVFANVDFTHMTIGQKGKLKEAIIEGYGEPGKVHVEIVGAAELASLLNSQPHIRSAYFATERFSTWEQAWTAHENQKVFGASVQLVGREEVLAQVRSMVDGPTIRASILAGPHNIGKTRLALEATRHRPLETVVALDPRSMNVSDLLALESPGTETVVIIEDPEPDTAEELVNQALARSGLKLLVTLPTAENAPAPSFGRDVRVQTLKLGPLSDEDARQLLAAAGAKLDFSMQSWVVEQAGGSPGILLVAASLGPDLRREAETFAEDVARAFERKIRDELGDSAVNVLRLLSLLTHVGFRGSAAQELETLCARMGDDLQPNQVLNTLPRLEDAGVVRLAGSHVEVIPPIVANRLAAAALRGRTAQLYELIASLGQAGRLRLLRRLRNLRQEEAASFWNEMFGEHGLFKDFQSAMSNLYLLRLVAGVMPDTAARLIRVGLEQMIKGDRYKIAGDARRELVWAIDELLFHRKSSKTALYCLALLAEAENETWSNNATGVFCECFHPQHPQLPLPLQDRRELLQDLTAPGYSRELRLLGVKAIQAGLSRTAFTSLRRSSGPDPFDPPARMTYGEVWDYLGALVDLLMELVLAEDDAVAREVGDVLPRAIAEYAIQARPGIAVDRFRTVVDWVLNDRVPVPVSDLADDLRYARNVLREPEDEVDQETRDRLRGFSEEMDGLLRALGEAGFSVRLRRWVGKWTSECYEYEQKNGERTYRAESELRRLAEEAVRDPKVMTDEILAWLCSPEAQKAYIFCFSLGEADSDRRWAAKIDASGRDVHAAVAFAAYWGGQSKSYGSLVSDHLDELLRERRVSGEGLVRATAYLEGDLRAVERVETLIRNSELDPVLAERLLVMGRWMHSLSSGECLRLLKAIAGPELEQAMAAIDFLRFWLSSGLPVDNKLTQFAWRCLETASPAGDNDAFECDFVASALARKQVDMGFNLLSHLLRQPYGEGWQPLGYRRQNQFWNTLCNADRERALRIVLSTAAENPLQEFWITWGLREIIDQESNADLLVSIALEDERQATLISESITSGSLGFWPIALQIIERYQGNREIQGHLEAAVRRDSRVLTGPPSLHLEKCRKEVDAVLSDPNTPAAARPWLTEVESSLRDRAQREVVSEIDEEVDDLRQLVEDPAAPDRLWAISALLRLGKLADLLRWMSKGEVLDILPKLELPTNEEREIRRQLGAGSLHSKPPNSTPPPSR